MIGVLGAIGPGFAIDLLGLRPQDFSAITDIQKYVRHTLDFTFDTSYYRPVSFHLDYRFGTRVNYDPPDGVIPFLAARTSANGTLTVRPNKSLRVGKVLERGDTVKSRL